MAQIELNRNFPINCKLVHRIKPANIASLRLNRLRGRKGCDAKPPQIIYKTVVLHYDKPLTNDKILQKNSPKLANGK